MTSFRLWSPMHPFDHEWLENVPQKAGIYVIYLGREPYYVGHTNDLHRRLNEHGAGRGSRKIREGLAMNWRFIFTVAEMESYQQAEAQLIDLLGTRARGNLRIEKDPAERFRTEASGT